MAKPKEFIGREISWLSFNERVLQEAADPSVPLLERLKFLAIFSNNLDEFFRVRVATLKRLIEFDKGIKPYILEKPRKTIERIQTIVQGLQQRFDSIFSQIKSQLEVEGIIIVNETSLCPLHAQYVKDFYKTKLAPCVNPMMISRKASFPQLSDSSIYLAVKLSKRLVPDVFEYSLIEIPTGDLSRFVQLPAIEGKDYIILLDDAIRYCLDRVFSIFPFDTYEAYTIKITRDAELDVDNDIAESLLETVSKGVKNRRQGQPVRFVYDSQIAHDLLEFIQAGMDLDSDDNMMPGGRYHNFRDFMGFPSFGKTHLLNSKLPPVPIPQLESSASILEVMARKDFSLHYPYHSFLYYIRMLTEASIDPKVTSIKITLYRVATESKVVRALMNAAQNGKEVTAVIELMARFDEGANIYWSKRMEEAGIKVIFGLKGLKVHSKMTLITRQDNGVVSQFCSLSTGNFHEGNANIYTDFNLFTADKRITQEVDKLFVFLEFNYKSFAYKHLLVSPVSMRRRINQFIDQEIANAKRKQPAFIYCKINNLVDQDIIRRLYQASEAGVTVKLMVRGICALIPQKSKQGKPIEVISVVGRFLEHSRIFIFHNGGDEKYYISSADWMTRNLDYRVEVAAPVYDADIRRELKQIIEAGFRDNVKARIIDSKQTNSYVRTKEKRPYCSQVELHNYYTTGKP